MLMACPVASIVRLPGEVFAIAGSVLLSVIPPLTLKLMVSCPGPCRAGAVGVRSLVVGVVDRCAKAAFGRSPRVVGRVDRYRIAGRMQLRIGS